MKFEKMKFIEIFHGTTTEHLDDIIKNGLKPRNKTKRKKSNWSLASRLNHVYLSLSYSGYFAICALDKKFKYEPVILKIKIPKNKFNNLYPDEDFLGQAFQPHYPNIDLIELTKSIDLEKFKNTWPLSLEKIGNVSYKGIISTDMIVDYRIIKDKKVLSFMFNPTITIVNYIILGKQYENLTRIQFGENLPNPLEEQEYIFETVLKSQKK